MVYVVDKLEAIIVEFVNNHKKCRILGEILAFFK